MKVPELPLDKLIDKLFVCATPLPGLEFGNIIALKGGGGEVPFPHEGIPVVA